MPACLILDVELPDINGLDLQRQIAEGDHPPIVFITGHGDIPSSVRAIKHGAVDFLTKPFSDADLMAAIHAAIAQDREKRSERAELGGLRQRYLDLTPREREVLPLGRRSGSRSRHHRADRFPRRRHSPARMAAGGPQFAGRGGAGSPRPCTRRLRRTRGPAPRPGRPSAGEHRLPEDRQDCRSA